MNDFIGRATEIRESIDLLRTIEDGVVQDVVGVHGVGKSMLLERLAAEAADLNGVRVLALDMARHGLGAGFRDDYGPSASAAVLWETFDRSRELMRRFAEQRSQEFSVFREVCQYQSRLADDFLATNDVKFGRRSDVHDVQVTSTVNVSEEHVKQRIREAQSEVDSAFIEAWSEFTVRRRILITVDTFQLVVDDELGQWMIHLAMQLPKTLVVIARTPSGHTLGKPSRQFRRLYLSHFTPAEVRDYLRSRFRHEELRPGIAEVVHTFTDGHPGGVALATDLISEKGPETLEASRLRRMLERLPADPTQKWAELVHLILDAVEDPRLRDAVDAAALTPTFDPPLLAQLLGDADDAQVGQMITRLRGLRLLEQVPSLSGEPSDRFRLHEFIRLSVAARVRTYHPQRWRELHSTAAQHYFRLLQESEDGKYESYGSWYRYEDADWQERKREWLHHSSLLPGKREITRARFTLVFLEAFWWWGYYLPFPLNRRLLEDWERTSAMWSGPQAAMPAPVEQRADPDRQLADALTYLLDNYPVSHLKPATAPWDEIRAKLLLVKRLCGLRQGAPAPARAEERQDLARTDALITLLLAQTRRFRDPLDRLAGEYYERATGLFDDLGDDWTVSWLLYEQADLAFEAGDLGRAGSFIGLAAVRAGDLAAETREWDHELLANLHRTRADVQWHAGELEQAAASYGRAIAHAYWFNGEPHCPDEYTQQFYLEITTRAVEKLVALAERPGEARSLMAVIGRHVPGGLTAEIPSITAGDDHSLLRESLFPRGPASEELRSEDSPFMDHWNVLCEERVDAAPGLAELAALATGPGSGQS